MFSGIPISGPGPGWSAGPCRQSRVEVHVTKVKGELVEASTVKTRDKDAALEKAARHLG